MLFSVVRRRDPKSFAAAGRWDDVKTWDRASFLRNFLICKDHLLITSNKASWEGTSSGVT